ncbi:beclin 1-associated autophagy-related key regulator-like [Limulus polyphemus]|uniref:Beclin 1-associated autophagy-related key regulator-like n=1 Tax=Limulus polyphemus TaxID=6850 RepID=A0ABM1TEJ1_LIMPO|nr:beclin 1-associated autophagy-related key regulator-like [Limulus polyphemus]
MATSCSSNDSSSAPIDFRLSSSLSSNNGKGSVYGSGKCPLCTQSKRIFFCQDCIRNGDFTHCKPNSKSRYPERYAEKKLKLFKASHEKSILLESFKEKFSTRSRLKHLVLKKQQLLQRIELLELSLKESKETVKAAKSKLHVLEEDIQNLNIKSPKYKERLQKGLQYISKCQNTTEEQRELLQSVSVSLRSAIKENIFQLTTWILPVKKVETIEVSKEVCYTTGPLADLAEAQQTTYVKGKWVYTNSIYDLQYQIVESFLSGSGNYSAYSIWVAKHTVTVPSGSGESFLRNPGYNIAAALTYLSQLVSVLAFYLTQQLPHYQCYSEFCSHELTEKQFAHKVAKLNANVLHLCLSQNVASSLLSPRQTVPNLLLLLDSSISSLGRCGAYEISPQLLVLMEESLEKDLQLIEENPTDTVDVELAGDWETVSELPGFEDMPIPSKGSHSVMTVVYSQSHPLHHPDTTASIASGLVSSAAASVASLWRAATGQK